MKVRIHIKNISSKYLSIVSIVTLGLLCGCSSNGVESLDLDHSKPTAKCLAFNISLQSTPEYEPAENKTESTSSSEKLISEWVKVNTFNATRGNQELGGGAPCSLALMELVEDTISSGKKALTRGIMPSGIYFRVIAFKKSGASYVFQSVADYISNGSSSPTLQQGSIDLPTDQTYRFVAYSFNQNVAMGTLPSTCAWASTAISIPNLNSDFLTYTSDDITPSGQSLTLPLNFTHQLCRLTVKINVTGFSSNTFTNCTGVQVKQGGNQSTWIVGSNSIAANTNDTSPFNMPDNGIASLRLVPFNSNRNITVYFNTLTVGGKVANNTSITSAQGVQLNAGRSYTITVQLKSGGPGIIIRPDEINLGGVDCADGDKSRLGKLAWADGNLKSTGTIPAGDYVWGSPTEYGYYYTWMSLYTGNSTVQGNQDPCLQLHQETYGTGWRTPSKEEFESLLKCSNKIMDHNGMWFMNNTKGVFLPAGGFRYGGSGTTPTNNSFFGGFYWTSTRYNYQAGYYLSFMKNNMLVGSNQKNDGALVRCVRTRK